MAQHKKRTPEQLAQLRKLVGGIMVLVGFVILACCTIFGIANMPLVVIGLVLFVLGAIIAVSMRVFEIIIQLLSFS